VDITTTVHEGAVYHVSEMVWPESPVLTKQACAEASELKVGDVASRMALLSSKASVERRFGAMGYLDAKLAVMSKKDDATHQIAYSFAVVPGDPYTMAGVKTTGLNPDQQAEFNKAWKLAPGQIYNEDYVNAFLKTNPFMGVMQGYYVRPERAVDRKNKTVIVTILFSRSRS
jgi:outer membrane protein assembly factor BamA